MRAIAALLCIVTHAWTVNANVEKTIFVAPSPVALPNVRPGLDDLRLDILDAAHAPILATKLAVQFPTEPAPRGLESWYILRNLQEGRRYEVRICWPATVSLPIFVVATRLCLRLTTFAKLQRSSRPTSGWIHIPSLTSWTRRTSFRLSPNTANSGRLLS